MKHVKVLDCTLRDGGYVNDFNFGDETIKGMISKMVKSHIDIIECGFLKDIGHTEGHSVFSSADEIIPYIPKNTNNTSIIAMIDYGRYDLSKLSPYDGKSIDGIRDCFFKKDRFAAIDAAKEIMAKGYKVYVQPVDIMGYTDIELIEMITKVNEIKPYAMSMVDTFGAMDTDELVRLFSIIDHNLDKDIMLGFHSHNNMQMSFALSQKFIEISHEKRNVEVDGTVLGMGRGAGNTCTELILNYLNKKWNTNYDLNEFLDLIDIYMPSILKRYKWGYNIPNYIAGMYSAHVHNVNYLLDKHNINTKDMRIIIDAIEPSVRKRYDYDNLESIYVDYFSNKIEDSGFIKELSSKLTKKKILVLAPGKSLETYKDKIQDFISENKDVISISSNFIPSDYAVSYMFFSSQKRFDNGIEHHANKLGTKQLILTSNVKTDMDAYWMDYNSLIKSKSKWKYFDNSIILLLRLLNKLKVSGIYLAGFDGFSENSNYSTNNQLLEANRSSEENRRLNKEIQEMLEDASSTFPKNFIQFITPSLYAEI